MATPPIVLPLISQAVAGIICGAAFLVAAPALGYLAWPFVARSAAPRKRVGLAALALAVSVAVLVALVPTAMRPAFDPYADLGLSSGASAAEVNKVYRKLSMQHHPDRGGDAIVFQRIARAYEALTDPKMRANYDKFGNPEGVREGGSFGDMKSASEGEKKAVLVAYLVALLAVTGSAAWWALTKTGRTAAAEEAEAAEAAPLAVALRAANAAIDGVPEVPSSGGHFFETFSPLFVAAERVLSAGVPALGAPDLGADAVRRIYAAWRGTSMKRADGGGILEVALEKAHGGGNAGKGAVFNIYKRTKAEWVALLQKHGLDAATVATRRTAAKTRLDALIAAAEAADPRLR